jgi:hypothetical protein
MKDIVSVVASGVNGGILPTAPDSPKSDKYFNYFLGGYGIVSASNCNPHGNEKDVKEKLGPGGFSVAGKVFVSLQGRFHKELLVVVVTVVWRRLLYHR